MRYCRPQRAIARFRSSAAYANSAPLKFSMLCAWAILALALAAPSSFATASSTPPSSTPPSPSPTPSPSALQRPARDWNILFGQTTNTQTVQLTSAAQVALSGTSYFLRGSRSAGFGDIGRGPIGRMAWEAGVQMEEVRTTGTVAANLCQNSGNCVFDITTISPFGRVGLILLRSFDLQLRAGADLVVPVSVNSNVIAYQPFVPLSFLSAGVSVRFGHNPKYRFPIAFDYSTYVGSNNVVTLSRTMISIGYTWR